MCLIAIVLPLQGAALGVFNVLGPNHLHQPVTAAALVLEDVRRWRPSTAAPPPHVFAALGHFHAAAKPQQRHYHPADDASVERTRDGQDADDAVNAGAALVVVLALIPAGVVWAAPIPPEPRATRSLWSVRTGFVDLPERPPKTA